MTDDEAVDRQLRAVFDGLVAMISITKQLAWSAPSSRREHVQAMVDFLVDQSRLVDEAEARIGGRAAGMAAPSSHLRRNLLGEVHNDMAAALDVYTSEVDHLVRDIRARASTMGDTDEARLLVAMTEGLEKRLGPINAR